MDTKRGTHNKHRHQNILTTGEFLSGNWKETAKEKDTRAEGEKTVQGDPSLNARSSARNGGHCKKNLELEKKTEGAKKYK